MDRFTALRDISDPMTGEVICRRGVIDADTAERIRAVYGEDIGELVVIEEE